MSYSFDCFCTAFSMLVHAIAGDKASLDAKADREKAGKLALEFFKQLGLDVITPLDRIRGACKHELFGGTFLRRCVFVVVVVQVGQHGFQPWHIFTGRDVIQFVVGCFGGIFDFLASGTEHKIHVKKQTQCKIHQK